MSQVIQKKCNEYPDHPHELELEREKELIKRTICKGANDDELKLFMHACKKTGLDPFMRQIYGVKRKDGDSSVMTIQTGIDGLRLIADRTGNYAPGREPTFTYTNEGKLKTATAYLRKRTRDGVWHEVSATAFFDEYKPAYKNNFWEHKPHIMLAKCAEALVLRKAFPAEMSGVYTNDEMEQANNEVQVSTVEIEVEEPEQSVEQLQYFLQEKIEIPHAESFLFDYLSYVKSKLPAERKLQELMKEWIKEPSYFLQCYKSWLSKNKIDNFVGQKDTP